MIEKTLIVWRRTGKEHGEDSFQVNAPDVVEAAMRRKVEQLRNTADTDWGWWQLNDDVLVEIPGKTEHYKPTTRIYYLPKRHIVAISDMRFGGHRRGPRAWEPELFFYVHIGDIDYDPSLEAWVFSDLFADVLASRDGLIYRVKDLDDLAEVMLLGLIDQEKAAFILRQTQMLVGAMSENEFPYPELEAAMATDDELLAQVKRFTDPAS
jgi:hypothetical protein